MTSKKTAPLSAKSFLKSLGLAAGILVALNLFIQYVARNSVPRQLVRQMEATRGITHLALGNSLMAAGFDALMFDAAMAPEPVVAFNAGLGSSGTVEHLILLQRALHGAATVKVVIYGFFDFQLTDAPIAKLADLFGNRAMAFYLDPGLARRSYEMGVRDRFEFEFFRHVPMVVERAAIWANVERMRREMGEVGMPRGKINRFGRVADFALLEAHSSTDFASQCERLTEENASLSQPIVELIATARAQGAHVVIVEMPMHPYHQMHFYALGAWDRYRDHLRNLVKAQHAAYLNAADWIGDASEFADHLHLAPSGAKDFSRRLAAKIRVIDNNY